MGSKSGSRGPSLKTSSRRPKLMRAAATCPQLATSNASRNDLATLQPYGATTILSRVAGYSNEHAVRGSPTSSCSSPEQRSPESAGERKEMFEVATHQSGNYFSFPSFEDFLEYEEEERIRQEKGMT